MHVRKVFLSSTTADLAQYREIAGEVIVELNKDFEGRFSLVRSDMFKEKPTGEPETAVETSERLARKANWLVLIVGFWYGDVPKGAGCSVTESEFRAAKAAQLPIFVFKAGAKGQKPNAYRALPEEIERENLKDHVAPLEHKEKFEAFVASACAHSPPVIFKNIDHFREELKQTLKQRIDNDLAESRGEDDGRGIAIHVIETHWQLRESVVLTIESAKQLAVLKDIHDRLHRIRHFGIRLWREGVLNLWPVGAFPTSDTRLAFVEPMLEVTRRLAQIETKFELLSPDWQNRLGLLHKVINHFDGGSSQMGDDRKAFSALIDRFASRQQAAFSDTNATMQRCAAELARHHAQMISRGNKVLTLPGLTPEEVQALGDEIEQSLARHRGLQDALAHHADWQRAHDRLQGVDDSLDDGGDKSETPVSVTLAPAIDDLQEIESLVQSAPALWKRSPAPQKITDLAQQVLRNCALLRSCETADTYRPLRKAFDDLFFEVDTETLNIVNHSRDQALAFDRRLRPPPPPAKP